MRAALLGCGSMGTILGALITKNGGDITMIDANVAHVNAMNTKGVKIVGKMQETIPVHAITPDKMEGIYDIVILLTKQTVNPVVLPHLLPFLGPNSVVCTLQNGVPEASVGSYVGMDRVVGGTIGWGATWLDAGVSELVTDPPRMKIEIGELNGEHTDRIEAVANLIRHAHPCDVMSNLQGTRWSKLLMNAAMSGMSAACCSLFSDILDDEKAVRCAVAIANELIKVATMKGIKLEVLVKGYDFYDLLYNDKKSQDRAVAWLREFYIPHRPSKASMMQDMEKRRKCEINQLNGVVCEGGREFGIPTPFNDMVVKIVTNFEKGPEQPFPTMKEVELFPDPFVK